MSLHPLNDIFKSQQSKLVRASVKRATINSVNAGTRTADVYFNENPQTIVRNIPIASGIDVSSISKGMQARVDTFDETNPNNMVISYVMGQASPANIAQKRFIDLTDVPPSYASSAGEVVRVNPTEDGLEFHQQLFTDLGDVPNSYIGAGGYKVKVKMTEDGLEFDPDTPGGGGAAFILYRLVNPVNNVNTYFNLGGFIEMPENGIITDVGAYVDSAGFTGQVQIDVKKNGISILSTPITIDSGQTSSRTAAVPPVILDGTFFIADNFSFDVQGVPTTKPQGLVVRLNF